MRILLQEYRFKKQRFEIEDIIKKQSKLETCYFDQLLWKIWNIAEWNERHAD